MIRKEQKIRLIILFTIFSIIFIGVGYAIFTTQLDVKGVVDVDKTDWDVHFENLQIIEDTTGNAEATISPESTTVEYTVNLEKPGDRLEFTVDAVNNGTINAMIGEIAPSDLTEEQEKYIYYSVTYNDDIELKEKQLLNAGEKEKLKVSLEYNYEVETLLDENDNNELILKIQYIKNDGTGKYIRPLCKRATELHTEECTQTDTHYCSGAGYTISGSKGTTTISYGNLGTKGVLNSGDAFDCDVNDDKIYNPTTERFYYVSPKDGNTSSEYITLIYYNNLGTSYYNSLAQNYNGPITAINVLPSTTEWSNPRLNTGMTRQIKNELGTTKAGNKTISSFSYTGKAARLLTAQEINKACGITVKDDINGELDSCEYLLENTDYAHTNNTSWWWIETPVSANNVNVWFVGGYRDVGIYASNKLSGVRPAIEVKYEDIDY